MGVFIFRYMRGHSYVVYAIWASLLAAMLFALFEQNWALAFLALATFLLSLLPVLFANRFGVQLPVAFFAAVTAFVFGTIFLGEVFDFYEQYWWWDLLMHGGSAVGFGLVGFIFVFMLFEGDRYAAPAWALCFFAFCFAVTIGVLWEIFEFSMDQFFGFNMQKTGLLDTMSDLIVNIIGAFFGASAGFAYLRFRSEYGLAGQISDFVRSNRRFFRRIDLDEANCRPPRKRKRPSKGTETTRPDKNGPDKPEG